MRGFTEPDAWTLEALCRGQWELFDAVQSVDGKDYYPYLTEAQAICAECPVLKECRRAGRGEPTGIWGGEAK